MTNDLVENNKGIIGSYKIESNYIYVYYLDKHMERYEFNLETIQAINDKMLNQALDVVISSEKRAELHEKLYNAISFGMMGLMVVVSAAYNYAYGDNITLIEVGIECVAMGVVPLLTRGCLFYMDKEQVNNIKKYQLLLENYKEFIENADNENTYNGIENKGNIGINTADSYSLEEVTKMIENIRTRSKV